MTIGASFGGSKVHVLIVSLYSIRGVLVLKHVGEAKTQEFSITQK